MRNRSKGNRSKVRVLAAVLAAVTTATSLATVASAAEPDSLGSAPPGAERAVDADHASSDLEALHLPPVPDEMGRLASDLTEEFRTDNRFASAEVTKDRTKLIVHWHGNPDQRLHTRLASAPSVTAEIRRTKFQAGALRKAARSILADSRGVSAVTVLHDGSGLIVSAATAADISRSTVAETAAPFPVRFETDSYSAAVTRQNDLNYHLGGARIYRFEDPFIRGGCTSGFAVRKTSDPSTQAIMTAAHCGAVGSQWITSDGTSAYHYGNLTQRSTAYDGAIIDTEWSQPYVWIGPWNSSSYTVVNSQRTPYVGQELCYSGSYSGVVCGNVVEETGFRYNLGGDLTSVTGFRTEQRGGSPAAGNGDSGGPGYEISVGSTGAHRYAVGIISAISLNSGTACNGVPGEPGPTGRKCSSTVISTSVVRIGNQLGWFAPITSNS